MGVSKDEFCSFYPFLYHMAWDGSWPTIQKDGLLSTAALLDLYGVSGAAREAIEEMHRPKPVTITHPTRLPITIRDQHPMSEKALSRCLEAGTTPRDWYKTLNSRVFFWLSEDRLSRMLNCPAYAKLPHLVLKLQSRIVIDEHWDSVNLAAMNTGCTVPFAHPRGLSTFLPPDKYPWAERKSRGRDRVVEFTVLGGVRHVEEALIHSERRVPVAGLESDGTLFSQR